MVAMTPMLFLHGAGGFDEDRPLADALGAAVRAEVVYPRLSADDMAYEDWAAPIRTALDDLTAGDHVVAHSFGASILLRVLAETPRAVPQHAALLAMPDWSRNGWDVGDYAFTGPEPRQALTLHHCRDDDVVPVAHLALHASRLPSAVMHEHPTGGHQFEGRVAEIAGDILR